MGKKEQLNTGLSWNSSNDSLRTIFSNTKVKLLLVVFVIATVILAAFSNIAQSTFSSILSADNPVVNHKMNIKKSGQLAATLRDTTPEEINRIRFKLILFDPNGNEIGTYESPTPGSGLGLFESVEPGVYTFVVASKDKLSNDGAKYSIEVDVEDANTSDSEAPVVDIQSPVNRSQVSGDFIVSGTASDNDTLREVKVRVGDNGWISSDNRENWSVSFDSRQFGNREQNVQVKAYDNAGNHHIESIRIFVVNESISQPEEPVTAPGGEGSTPSDPVSPPPTTGPINPQLDGFYEGFDTSASLSRFDTEVHHRGDHDEHPSVSGSWVGDHDRSCGAPGTTRTIDTRNRADSVYWCRGHLMTSMGDVDGYSVVAFSPKQTFETVSKVCWDVNVTDLGGRQWVEVIITPANAMRTSSGEFHLAHSGPGTIGVDNKAALHVNETLGVKMAGIYDALTAYQNGGRIENVTNRFYLSDPEGLESRAIRRQHCITDLGNGTIELRVERGGANEDSVSTFRGSMPDNARVIFEDHNYTPDKDGEACRSRGALTGCRYTWHWDNISIEE